MKDPLDVLIRQEDSNVAVHIPIRKIRFEDLQKPTHIEPLNPVKFEDFDQNYKIKNFSAQKTFSHVVDLNLERELDDARHDYVRHLVVHTEKNNKDEEKFKGLMSELGANKAMPKREEPKELVISRKKYHHVKNKKSERVPHKGIFEDEERRKVEEFRAKHLTNS